MQTAGIYIHIPFCKVKCIYCDFYSITEREHQREHFTEMLCREIELYRNKNQFEFKINTIFIGGGTPSLLTNKQLDSILNCLAKNYPMNNILELTMEVNPGEAPKEKLAGFRKSGVNRLSMGFQSLQPKLLEFLTRSHSKENALETYNTARDVGFENVNIDLIFSIPNQTLNMLEDDLKLITDLNPNHISAYSLTVESGTELNKLVKKKQIIMPKDESDLEMLLFIRDFLKIKNYSDYEISNFSKPGFECNHNLHYWNTEPYLAFGPSAHGFNMRNRWWNVRSLDEYLKRLDKFKNPINSNEKTDYSSLFNEVLLNGLRLKNGIQIEKLNKINPNWKTDLKIGLKRWNGKLDLNENSLQLTHEGIPFLDSILPDLFID
ncbi:MAG: hypothetical protein CMF96_05765 [Candidatus Marinimicrobia bacterium]|nr:hypothetical protein [Candidatus Neomarinimicrobiota bacterium]|tara:strand:+ start:5046 stop:6179 length:1134 start_codon:yes stop_codon:yes gene_type:complete